MKNKLFITLLYLICFIFASKVLAEPVDLMILHTNDVHGKLLPFNLGISDYDKSVGGVARRFTLIKELKSEYPKSDTLLLDAGDIAQGTLFFTLYDGMLDINFMNILGYDVAEIGNHDFDKGSVLLSKWIDKAKFPFLSANLEVPKSSPVYGKYKPYIIKKFNNLRVGIIGLITEEVKIITNLDADSIVYDNVSTAQKYIDKIDKDTDLIIILSHDGFKEDKKLASKIRGADIIVGGHSHTELKKPVIVKDADKKDVIIVQTGEFGKNLGVLDVIVNNDKATLKSYKLYPIDASIKEDETIKEQLSSYESQIKDLSKQIVGKTSTSINTIRDEVRSKETSGGNLIVDAIKSKLKDIDVVMHNGGAIRGDKVLAPGNISLADVMEMNPFDNTVLVFDLKGKELKRALERSAASLPYSDGGFLQVNGISFLIDVSKPPQRLSKDFSTIETEGNRVSQILINGKPLEMDKTYKIATNEFIENGGNGFFSIRDNAKNIINTGLSISDILQEYLKNNSPVNPKVEDRIKIINIPAIKDDN